MSDRRRSLISVGVLLAIAAPILLGQDPVAEADALARELRAAVTRASAADSTMDSLSESRLAVRNSEFVVGSRRVRFTPAELSTRDTAIIAEGLRRADAGLVERFGADAASIIDLSPWTFYRRSQPRAPSAGQRVLNFLNRSRFMRSLGVEQPSVRVSFEASGRGGSYGLRSPLRVEDVERLALRMAGEGVSQRARSLREFGQRAVSLADEPTRWPLAARELALVWPGSGRRCLVGALGACEAVMSPGAPTVGAPAWMDRGDALAAVTAASLPPRADSALASDRRRCVQSIEMDACERALQRVVVPNPFSSQLHGTLVMHALDIGGPEALHRLFTAPDSTPLASLAYAAGVSTDSLLSGWRLRATAALRASRPSPLPAGFTTLGWCTLLLLAAVRRRP